MIKGGEARARILVVEDSGDQATLLHRILEPEGYDVDVVRDGEKALEQVREGGYGLVLMDIIMPGLSGLEACRILKEDPATRSTPIMLVTQLDSPTDMLNGLQAGAESYVTKPYERSQILHRIETLLRGPRQALGGGRNCEEAVEITFQGRDFEITAGRRHIADYLVATFEDILRSKELLRKTMLATVQDNTERKMAEEALRRSEAEYRGLVERAVHGIFRSSPEGRFLMVNPAMVRILGYGSEEELLVLDSIETVYSDPSGRGEVIRDFIESGQMDHFPVEWIRKDGDRVSLLFSGRPVADDDGEVAYFEIMAEDVTERRILEEQLHQAQRLEALGQLAGGVAHDFNNILSVIIVEAQLGMRRLGEDNPVLDRLSEIKAAGDRAADLTRQLLTFSRRQLVEPVVLSLNGMVSDLEKMLTRLIAEDIEFATALDETPANVLADRGQLEQILTNLVVNACDAMLKGGQLTIRTSTTTPDPTFLRTHPGMTSRPYAVLEVQDSGAGIPNEVKARMFDPFFTTKEHGKGTGLGLATVYGIVQKMDGHIDVESELEVGATEDSPLPRGTETVLVVEDDLQVRRITVQLLEAHGYTVMSAEDGAQALQQLGAYEGDVELLLTDVVLPGMGGRAVAEQVTKMRPETKVLYMSGYTDDKIFQQELVTHEISFLRKPFTAESFTAAVRKVLDQG